MRPRLRSAQGATKKQVQWPPNRKLRPTLRSNIRCFGFASASLRLRLRELAGAGQPTHLHHRSGLAARFFPSGARSGPLPPLSPLAAKKAQRGLSKTKVFLSRSARSSSPLPRASALLVSAPPRGALARPLLAFFGAANVSWSPQLLVVLPRQLDHTPRPPK